MGVVNLQAVTPADLPILMETMASWGEDLEFFGFPTTSS